MLYTIQVVFGILYADALPASDVYRVMNFVTAAGIAVSLTVTWIRRRCVRDPDTAPGRYLAAQAGYYSTLVLAIWFFTLWFRLLMLSDGEPIPDSDLVAWFMVAALNPIVLGTNGAILWKTGRLSWEQT